MALDATRIADRLYQGSWPLPGPGVAAEGFNVLVLCARELQYPADAYPGVRLLRLPIDDGDIPASDKLAAGRIAKQVAQAIQNGDRVLVTCQAGRNRSGLVVALTLRMLHRQMPMDAIIAHVQARRANALTNEWFVESLRRSCG